jgi:D-3-phosphoglycerate dehydrogenase
LKIKVPNRAFSTNSVLTELLLKEFPNSEANLDGKRYEGKELVSFLSGAEAAIVGLELIDATLLDQLPNLKIISKYGVGLDNIDLEACKQRGIEVGWESGVNKRSVAEMAVGFMLALSRNLYITSNQLKKLVWNKNGGYQLSDKKIGIIGLGNIGKEVITLLKPFGCDFLVNDIIDVEDFAKTNKLKLCSKDEIYQYSDIISVHTPLTPETTNLFNEKTFTLMKTSAFLINTARGEIVNQAHLKSALQNHLIAGAALDVYDVEPPIDEKFLTLSNLICTPHTGGNSYEAVVNMGKSAINHLTEYSKKMYANE